MRTPELENEWGRRAPPTLAYSSGLGRMNGDIYSQPDNVHAPHFLSLNEALPEISD